VQTGRALVEMALFVSLRIVAWERNCRSPLRFHATPGQAANGRDDKAEIAAPVLALESHSMCLTGGHDKYHNVALTMLGEFEYLLITTAAKLGNEAYGAAIRETLAATTGRKCSIGALYTTIDRLETKGFLKTWMGEATAQRGGRAKRMVRVTPKGVQAARSFYEAIASASRGASWAINKARVPS